MSYFSKIFLLSTFIIINQAQAGIEQFRQQFEQICNNEADKQQIKNDLKILKNEINKYYAPFAWWSGLGLCTGTIVTLCSSFYSMIAQIALQISTKEFDRFNNMSIMKMEQLINEYSNNNSNLQNLSETDQAEFNRFKSMTGEERITYLTTCKEGILQGLKAGNDRLLETTSRNNFIWKTVGISTLIYLVYASYQELKTKSLIEKIDAKLTELA